MYVASALIIALAILHSVLGEMGVLKPLFRANWEVEEVPRFAMERILRFAWHLTSIAWVSLGLTALGWPALDALAMCAAVSGGMVFLMLRGHFAWAVCAIITLAALKGGGHLPVWLTWGVILGAAGVSTIAGVIHVYWALGGRRWTENVIPRTDSKQAFMPPWWLTMMVAGALFTFAGLLGTALMGGPAWVAYLLMAATVVLGLRALGDGRQVGFLKTDRSTRFAQLDDALYTPLVTWMSVAAGAATFLL